MQSTWASLRNHCQSRRLNVYSSFNSYENELLRELNWFAQQHPGTPSLIQPLTDSLYISDLDVKPIWAKSIWSSVEFHDIESISDAVKLLKSKGKFWSQFSQNHFRRSELIQQQLFKSKAKKLNFLEKPKTNNFNNWLLLDESLLLLSTQTTSTFAQDKIEFNETSFPPSRAYLKLWELFTVHNVRPQPGQRVVDFGSSPGGWTWVLQNMGCHVLSVDKAPLSPSIAKLSNIEMIKKDAFTIKPQDLGLVDWFFSDIICYPEKLYEYLQLWLTADTCKNFAITIKLQGPCDFGLLQKFKAIPNSQVFHMQHNKHELTFVKVDSK